jgi:hypothetical protein
MATSAIHLANGLFGTFVALAVGQLLIGRAEIETAAPYGVFYFMAAAAVVLAVVAAVRSITTAPPLHLERPFEILTPQAASLAHDPLGRSGARLTHRTLTGSLPRSAEPHREARRLLMPRLAAMAPPA